MARSALIESLRDQAARDAEAVRDAVRTEAEQLRSELEAEREHERQRLDDDAAAEVRQFEAGAATEAAHAARESAARATVMLADRLLAIARGELPQLYSKERARIFQALADELPPYAWQRVRVNSADAPRARTRFPDAIVEEDPAICGGLDAAAEDGRVEISNTLETRLAVAWPELLPRLLEEIAGQDRGHERTA